MTPHATPSAQREAGGNASALLCMAEGDDTLRLASALAREGYEVEKVAADSLVAKATAEDRSGVVIADIDARDALHAMVTLQDAPRSAIELVVIASSDTTLLTKVNQLVTRGVGALFVKPIVIDAVLSKVRVLSPIASPPVHYRLTSSAPPPAAPADRMGVRSSSMPPPPPPGIRISSIPPSTGASGSEAPPIGARPSSRPPPPSTRSGTSSPPSPAARFATLPPVGTRGSVPPSPASVSVSRAPSGLPGVPEAVLLQAGLSQELAELLLAAESRIADHSGEEGIVPSPAEEIEAVLPREVLAVLDSPLDDDDDDDFAIVEGPSVTTGGGRRSSTTGVGDDGEHFTRDEIRDGELDTRSGKNEDTGTNAQRTNMRGAVSEGTQAEAQQSTSAHKPSSRPPPAPGVRAPLRSLLPAEPLPQVDLRIVPSSDRVAELPSEGGMSSESGVERPSLGPGAATWEERAMTLKPAADRPSVAPASVSHSGMIAREADAFLPLARAITGRRTITLTIRDGSAQRRIVLLGGDLVTAASDAPSETLIEFLVERGDMLRAAADRAAPKLPAGGRYAAAALVARGVLHNDDMWEVLRAHALWLCGKAMQVRRGSFVFESSAEADADLSRLLAEPAVFGAKSGAEVFLEVVRRCVTRETAERTLGGNEARVFLGEQGPLLSEAGLSEADVTAIRAHEGHRLGELVRAISEADAMQIVYGLALLEIFRISAPVQAQPEPSAREQAQGSDPIDDDARRSRIEARAALMQEGDYFALLGIPRQASSYEVRAAYLALRREFDPSRILTPQIAELAETVEKIILVLEEAYEVLRDQPRRERYLRAIVGLPRPF